MFELVRVVGTARLSEIQTVLKWETILFRFRRCSVIERLDFSIPLYNTFCIHCAIIFGNFSLAQGARGTQITSHFMYYLGILIELISFIKLLLV